MTMRALSVEAVGGEDNEQRSLGAQLGAQRTRGVPVLQPDGPATIVNEDIDLKGGGNVMIFPFPFLLLVV